VGDETAAVKQHEGVARADAAHVDRGTVAADARAAAGGLVGRHVGDDGEGGQHLDSREGIPHVERFLAEDRDRQNLLLVEALQVGAGHGDGLQLEDFLLFG
jgi:hypothetical protein